MKLAVQKSEAGLRKKRCFAFFFTFSPPKNGVIIILLSKNPKEQNNLSVFVNFVFSYSYQEVFVLG